MAGREHMHEHHHPTGTAHRSLWLGAGRRQVHRVGRRQFLTELGRGAFAIAVLGGVAACSGDDDPTADETGGATDATSSSTATTSDAATAAPPTAAPPTDPSSSSGAVETDLRWARASLGFVSAYVLVRGNSAAVVDTGSTGSADRIGEALQTLGATFDDVRHVVLTHSHPDHVGSLPIVLERSPGAVAYAGTLDAANISAEVTGVGDGDEVFGLEVIDTPGHTPGSISMLDPGIGLLVAGDALTGNDDGTGLSGSLARFTDDMSVAESSIEKLATYDIETIAVGHGEPVESNAGSLLQSLATSL